MKYKPLEQPRKIYGYIRVSSAQQAESGLSLEAQEAKIRAQAAVSDIFIDDIVSDAGKTAKNIQRPGLERVMNEIKAGRVDVVIVQKLDRLTRSIRDFNMLLELFAAHNTRLISVNESLDTTSAVGRLVLNIMMSVSQWEREAISERTRDALSAKRQRGEKTGGTVPFGYDVKEGKLVENDKEQFILVAIAAMREKKIPYKIIAQVLNERHKEAKTKTGLKWTPQTVAGAYNAYLKKENQSPV